MEKTESEKIVTEKITEIKKGSAPVETPKKEIPVVAPVTP